MRRLAFVVLAGLTLGCSGGKPATERALDFTERGLGAVNGVLLEAGSLHEQGAKSVVAYCRETRPNATQPEREACVAKFQYSLEQVARREQLARDLAALQDTMADVLAEMRRLLPQVETDIRAVRAAIKETK